MHRLAISVAVLAVLAAAACDDGVVRPDNADPTGPVSAEAPAFAIADAAGGFKRGFYWLRPMVEDPITSGTFDAALSPEVEICALDGGECDPDLGLIETFTMDGSGSTQVRLDSDAGHYMVNWHTGEYDLTEGILYRIAVFAGPGVLLGYADVEPVSDGRGLKNVNTDEYVGLIDGRTLPIRFRIETGIVASISIDPREATIPLGRTQPFTATVTDLHGNPLTAQVGWTSEDESVATVDAGGVATGAGPGTTTITATLDRVSASATLTVERDGSRSQISTGLDHTCGVTTDGEAFCWGQGFPYGQLGNGGTANQPTPVAVAGHHQFASISAGSRHTCGVTTQAEAFCWGQGEFTGKLGNGGTANHTSPVAVAGDHPFAAISAGMTHTCGVTTDGEALCWGEGRSGRLGNGGTANRLSPAAVAGDRPFASISAGGAHTCGVTTEAEAFCWGLGSVGRLGNGGTASALSPAAAAGDHAFASISASNSHTCGVTTDGDALCWGLGFFGALGNGGTDDQLSPVAVAGGHQFASISAGGAHTCGVTTDGEAFCWGSGSFGQLGNGGTDGQLSPVAVAGDHRFASISAGTSHSCGMTTDGEALCWGRGRAGRLGNGQTVDQLVPVLVSNPF